MWVVVVSVFIQYVHAINTFALNPAVRRGRVPSHRSQHLAAAAEHLSLDADMWFIGGGSNMKFSRSADFDRQVLREMRRYNSDSAEYIEPPAMLNIDADNVRRLSSMPGGSSRFLFDMHPDLWASLTQNREVRIHSHDSGSRNFSGTPRHDDMGQRSNRMYSSCMQRRMESWDRENKDDYIENSAENTAKSTKSVSKESKSRSPRKSIVERVSPKSVAAFFAKSPRARKSVVSPRRDVQVEVLSPQNAQQKDDAHYNNGVQKTNFLAKFVCCMPKGDNVVSPTKRAQPSRAWDARDEY